MVTNVELLKALSQYFTGLSATGYRNYNEVNQLLVLIVVKELIDSPLSVLLTEDDYKAIENMTLCFKGNCMFPYGSCADCK